jgi:hypothetical protein
MHSCSFGVSEKLPKDLIYFKYLILSFRYNANRCYMLFYISLCEGRQFAWAPQVRVHNGSRFVCVAHFRMSYRFLDSEPRLHWSHQNGLIHLHRSFDLCMCHFLFELLIIYGEGCISQICTFSLPNCIETGTAHNLVASVHLHQRYTCKNTYCKDF